MRAVSVRVLILALIAFGAWLVGKLLLPWLTRERIVVATAIIFLCVGVGTFVRLVMTGRGFHSAATPRRTLALNACVFLLVGISLLLAWHFVFP
jgi:hypothetical protein